jgi:hypothetical protein
MWEKVKFAILYSLSRVAWGMAIFTVFVYFWFLKGVFIATVVALSVWICTYVYALAKKEDE